MYIRSLLFAPANQPKLLKKFPEIAADCFVIDLEDAVPAPEKHSAREGLASIVKYLREADIRGSVFVRVNQAKSLHYEADLDVVLGLNIDGIVVPKIEEVDDLGQLGVHLSHAEGSQGRQFALLGGIESLRGVANVNQLAQCDRHLVGLYFGAEDYISEIGGQRTAQGLEVLYARSQTVLAAKMAGIAAIDQAVLNIREDDQFRDDGLRGRNMGYSGKICLLPRQADLANQLFSPTAREISWSKSVLAAASRAASEGRGVFEFEGQMIDEPLLKRASAISGFADEAGEG